MQRMAKQWNKNELYTFEEGRLNKGITREETVNTANTNGIGTYIPIEQLPRVVAATSSPH